MSFSQFSTGSTSEVNFVPEVFSKLMQAKFYKTSVLPAISNTDYEGEISGQGDKVVIRTVPAVTINNYTGTVSTQELTTSKIELLIDKAKYFSFLGDDILRAQADIDFVTKASDDAAEGMRVAVETDVLASVVTGATTIQAQAAVTDSNVLTSILSMSTQLDELNIPEEGRFIVLSPEFISALKRSELRQAYLTGDSESPLRNGKVGTVDRFTVYQSNMLYTPGSGADSGYTHVLAGHPKAISFASQFTNTETQRMESTFGDQVRGLKVYGSKVVVPDALVVGKWTQKQVRERASALSRLLMDSEVRLQRIENKLDQLSELVGQIARVDERVVSIHKRLDRHEKRLDWLEEQKRDLETVVSQGSATTKLYERAGWIVFSAIVAFIATYMVD